MFRTLLNLTAAVLLATTTHAASIPDDVKQVIRHRVDNGDTISIIVAFVTPDGVEYFAHGNTAVENGDPVNEQTVYEIGSITKAFTGILLAEMVARGEVAYDDPIQKYLPEDVTVPTHNDNAITLEHLSVQTSALPRLPNNLKPADPTNPYADYTVDHLYEFLANVKLGRDPGEKYAYSNVGVGLLGHVLSRAAGKDYETLVIERIANPLEMHDTRIAFTESMRERLAKPHAGGKPSHNWDLPTFAGAGALRSTAADMARFLQANLGLLDSSLTGALEDAQRPRAEAGSSQMHIGLGWHIYTTDSGRDIVWHNGGTGGYRAFTGFIKDDQVGVAVLTNMASEMSDDLGFYLLDPDTPMARPVQTTIEEMDN